MRGRRAELAQRRPFSFALGANRLIKSPLISVHP